MTAVLVATRADRVAPGDRIDSAGTARTVTSVTSGANRQIYIATVSEGGAPVVVERDPDETVTVWRDQ